MLTRLLRATGLLVALPPAVVGAVNQTDDEAYLYNMQADPGEEHNLVKDPQYRKLANELKQKASAGWIKSPRPRRASSRKSDGQRLI